MIPFIAFDFSCQLRITVLVILSHAVFQGFIPIYFFKSYWNKLKQIFGSLVPRLFLKTLSCNTSKLSKEIKSSYVPFLQNIYIYCWSCKLWHSSCSKQQDYSMNVTKVCVKHHDQNRQLFVVQSQLQYRKFHLKKGNIEENILIL